MTTEETLALKPGDVIETTTGKTRLVSYACNGQLRVNGKLVVNPEKPSSYLPDPNYAYASTRGVRNGCACGANRRPPQWKRKQGKRR